jgi:hypothetical protein
MSSKTSKHSTSNISIGSTHDFLNVQTKIQSSISHYNTHNETNVMDGIKQIKNKKWQVNYQGFKLIRADKESAILELKNYLIAKHNMIDDVRILAAEDYNKNKILIYDYKGKLLFDLYHISHIMDISTKKLTEDLKNNAIKYLVKNKYGGYEIKLLIDNEAVSSLISLKKNKTNTFLITFVNELTVRYSKCKEINTHIEQDKTEDILSSETYESSNVDDTLCKSTIDKEIIENHIIIINETNRDELI